MKYVKCIKSSFKCAYSQGGEIDASVRLQSFIRVLQSCQTQEYHLGSLNDYTNAIYFMY